MNNAKHTPGPWIVHTFTISGKEKLEVLDATGTNACVQANAHLIAAAPAMYEALQVAHTALSILPIEAKQHLAGNAVSIIENAIAQAEGRHHE